MAEHARPGSSIGPGSSESASELVFALDTRFAPGLAAAAAAVREAERRLAEARARAEDAARAAETPYASDPLVFMRQAVEDEVEALGRKTTEKKLRASYRFLLDRAVELATAEVQRFHDDQAATERERLKGLDACRADEQRAEEALEAAREMHARVRHAERTAQRGLQLMVGKLSNPT